MLLENANASQRPGILDKQQGRFKIKAFSVHRHHVAIKESLPTAEMLFYIYIYIIFSSLK